jgi:hypothetical protein
VVEAEDKGAPGGAGVKTAPVGEEAWAADKASGPGVSVSVRTAVTRPPMNGGYLVSNKSAPSAGPI